MTDIDEVLDQCLTAILTGDSTLDECLERYPEYSEQLTPLLRTAIRFETGSRVKPAPEFKLYARNRLRSHMQAYPRQKEKVSFPFPFRRLMAGAIALLLTLFVTGTVYAQGVLPGDPFYDWKLHSERAWRLVSSDAVTTDLRIANRRINEMNVTIQDEARWARALEGFIEVRSRLEVEMDAETLDTILPPAELFSYPEVTTATPVQVFEPTSTTSSPSETSEPENTLTPGATEAEKKEKDKDEKDEEKQREDKEKRENGTATVEPEVDIPLPTPTEPVVIPTIEIPPPPVQ